MRNLNLEKYSWRFCDLVVLMLFSCGLFAGVGTDGMTFLKIKPSARAAVLGDGFTAVADDANSVFYNPACLGGLKSPEISLMHMAYIADTSFESGAFALKLSESITGALSVIYLNYGAIPYTRELAGGNYDTASTGSFSPFDLSVGLSFGFKLSNIFSAGFTVKYLTEGIDTFSAGGLAGDAGLTANVEGVDLGVSISNAGFVHGLEMPLLIRAGAGTRLSLIDDNDLTLAGGVNFSPAGGRAASVGAEYAYDKMFIVRAGYALGYDLESLNAGAGFKYSFEGVMWQVDYGFSLFGDAGNAHRISLSAKFDDGSAQPVKTKKTTSEGKGSPKKAIKYYFRK